MKTQRGLTLLGLIFFLILAAMAAWVAFKIVPAYIDYYTVQHSLENVVRDTDDQTNESLRKTFDARLNVNFIRDITARDLVIEREDGVLTLSVLISRKERLVGGVSVCVDLEARATTALRK